MLHNAGPGFNSTSPDNSNKIEHSKRYLFTLNVRNALDLKQLRECESLLEDKKHPILMRQSAMPMLMTVC